MSEINAIVNVLVSSGRLVAIEAATTEEIAAFEDKHGVRLPALYKEWLLLTDGGECYPPAGVQFYGVAHKPLINVDDNDRPDADYIPIGALSTGDPILFKKGEDYVAIYNREGDVIEDDESYKDFLAFLNDLDGILGLEG